MSLEPTSLGPNWWTSLNHRGLLIAPPLVAEFFSADLNPLPEYKAELLRRAVTKRAESGINALLDTVFLQILEHEKEAWNRNPPADKWSHRLLTGDSARPHRLLQLVNGDAFPLFTEKPDVRLDTGRGRQSTARVVEWLRKAGLKVALLATEQQWRLIYAGSDFEAWCEWNLDRWFEGGQPSLQVEALRHLLDSSVVPERLVQAIQDSRRGQAELTSTLGERVREAVEKLVQSSAANLEALDVLPGDIYLAATRMIMRCVVALFAEGKGMLGRDMPGYHDSYGVQGLREQLERIGHGRLGALSQTQFAWPRLVSLFRLIHAGSTHPQMTIMRYGGTLFEPGDRQSADPIFRAVAAFETTHPCPRDRDVYEILALLTRTYIKVSQGRGARAIATPVDFSNLDTEYIGILYEGLLDYDLKKATVAVVFVRMGDEPALPISDLETIAPDKLKEVFGKLKKKSKIAMAEEEDDDSEEDETEEETPAEDNEETTLEAEEPVPAVDVLSEGEEQIDSSDQSIERARRWAVEAVKAASIVRKPRRQTADAIRAYDADVEKAAKNLFSRVVRPGDWYLVRFGNTRKGSGTFYTRKELASPTVRRTLQPLVYTDDDVARKPEEILTVKVCDPAVGSGSFLISALRYITEALFKSLYQHGRIEVSGANTFYNLGIGPPEHLPTGDDFDDRLKARLRRYVVERCLYGVDLNPLAIELARMSLWIETMDARLPFGFLDHKLRTGNTLVGCWFDRFGDYPVMAWEREGGDKDYLPINPHTNWTESIKQCWNDRVKPDLVEMVRRRFQPRLPGFSTIETIDTVQNEIRAHLERIHALPVHEVEMRRELYYQLRGEEQFLKIKLAFDLWTALWFWPPDQVSDAPIPSQFLAGDNVTASSIAENVRQVHQFFHWELEFPDVFTGPLTGFDAVIGNPPWETLQPVSKEFFSNIDPLYRALGKQEALGKQREIFQASSTREGDWLRYKYFFSAFSNFQKTSSDPSSKAKRISFTRSPKKNSLLNETWAAMSSGQHGYSDPRHPFAMQGEGKVYTYKMFLETAIRLVREGGRVGLLVPGGIYSDLGSAALRGYLLNSCTWGYLYTFQNEKFIFENVDHRYKVAVLGFVKQGQTNRIRTRFRIGPGDSPRIDEVESDMNNGSYLAIEKSDIDLFSPSSQALLEVRSAADLGTFKKIYSSAVLLKDQEDKGWGITWAQGDFNMTSASKLFQTRTQWEDRGYLPDEYGHWLRGGWGANTESPNILERGRDSVLSADGTRMIQIGDIEDVVLPLYQGVMFQQFDFSAKGWLSGTGLRAKWEVVPWSDKRLRPQYLVRAEDFCRRFARPGRLRLAHRRIGRTTDTRSVIASLISRAPAGNNAPVFTAATDLNSIALACVFNSYVFEYVMRARLTGTQMDFHVFTQTPLPVLERVLDVAVLITHAASLNFVSSRWAPQWQMFRNPRKAWRRLWAVTPHERTRLRSILDAILAKLFELDMDDFRHILRDCDHSVSELSDKAFCRKLDPKGFWRVDKDREPHLRQTVLSLVAFQELERLGLAAFLELNAGEGWMIPETLRLSDYGLGHGEDRAKEYQSAGLALGERFFDWQLAQSVEDSWEECTRRAELIERIVPCLKRLDDEPKNAEISLDERFPLLLNVESHHVY
jgi:hypothetical protein